MIRQTIFWLHLICGVAAGLVILMMSVTGVLLTYERQIVAWVEHAEYAPPQTSAAALPLEALLARAKEQRPEFSPQTLMRRNEPGTAVTLGAGRNGSLLANPYTGDVAEPATGGVREFFATITGWHRWFNASGEARATARAVTGASNVAFLFLVLSGIYLWLPRIYKWAAFKMRLFFNPKAGSSKARDFNWHHVFGIWSALPLAVVVATATVFSYPWASDLVYRVVGEEPPVRGGPPGGGAGPGAERQGGGGQRGRAEAGTARAETELPSGGAVQARLTYDELFARAAAHTEWQTLTLTLPADPAASTVRFAIDQGNGGQPYLRHTLTLDATSGSVTAWAPFSSQSTGQKARSWIRFLHTGEALGLVGQTIAGIVSAASVLMVWTGLALAWRRLIVPLYRRKT
jgi:uncharacterized iron-regulated membrane protein